MKIEELNKKCYEFIYSEIELFTEDNDEPPEALNNNMDNLPKCQCLSQILQ